MTDRGRAICLRVARRVAEVVPPGLGSWDGSWDLVAGPSDAFLDRLNEWEREDTAHTRAELEAAVNDFVRAWRRATEAWEAAGRPTATVEGRVPALAGGIPG